MINAALPPIFRAQLGVDHRPPPPRSAGDYDVGAGSADGLYRGGVGGGVGDQGGDVGDRADAGEADAADLGAVGHHEYPVGAVDHGGVGVRLDLVVGGEPAAGADAVDADHRDLDVQPGERLVGDRADQLVGLGAGHAAGHDQLQPGAQRQLGGDVQRVGHHGQVDALGQQAG